MKRFWQVLAILLIVSTVSGMVAAMGLQRTPESPLYVWNLAEGKEEPRLSLLQQILQSPRVLYIQSQIRLATPTELGHPQVLPDEEHIEATDKPDALDVTPENTELIHAGDLPILVNRDNVLPKEYVPKLVTVPGTYYQCSPETLEAYTLLMADAKAAGHTKLRLQSAYRSYNKQNDLHIRKVNSYKGKYGDNAAEMAAQIVAPPGQSEHQLGQALDISNGSLVQSFGETPAGVWLAENAHKYGFILRYQQDTTEITGILYEPWHFRYVGVDIATLIYDNHWSLEEFFEAIDA